MRIFALGFALGLCVVLQLPTSVHMLLLIVGLLMLLIVWLRSRACLFLLLGLMTGGLLAKFHSHTQLAMQLSPAQAGGDFNVVGTVVGVPARDDRRTRFLFRIDRRVAAEVEGSNTFPAVIQLSWYGPASRAVHAGDQWQFVVRLKSPSSLGNPGSFRYARWLFQQRIHATGYVRDTPKPKRLLERPMYWHAVRQILSEQILALNSATEFAALVQGLTVGISDNIDSAHLLTLRQTGTAHLLAISGLHIGLVAAWSFFLASFLWRLIFTCWFHLKYRERFNTSSMAVNTRLIPSAMAITKRGTCLLVSFVFSTFYAALAGFSLPTTRALTMLIVLVLLSLLRRHWPPGSALLMAMLLVLMLDLLAILSVGFWLSFGTVAALFYLHQGRMNRMGDKTSALMVHWKLGFVMLPMTAWFFQQGALIAPVANAIAVPVVGVVVVPLSLVIVSTAGWLPVLADGLLFVVQWVMKFLFLFLGWLAQLPSASVPLFLPGLGHMLCLLCALLFLFAPRALHLRWLCVPLLAPALLVNILGAPVRGFELHVLDVGQGLSAVVFTRNHTLVFDTGRRLSTQSSMVERVVQPFLTAKGRSRVDVVVVSHADDDHAGGLEHLRVRNPAIRVYASDEEHQSLQQADSCEAGKRFSFDGVEFSFLHPGQFDVGTRNEMSCVLLIHHGSARVLLTGDIEAGAEASLISRMSDRLPVDVLVAPHHGSRSSSTTAFIETVMPAHVIFAAGEGNRYGFPHPDVVDRYAKKGAATYTTGSSGAISAKFDKNGLRGDLTEYWQDKKRFYSIR